MNLPGKYLESSSYYQRYFLLSFIRTPEEFVAVAPVIRDTTGQRGFTLNVNTQGAGCYSNNLLADLQTNGDVFIHFETGTFSRCRVFHWREVQWRSFIEIEKITNQICFNYDWVDSQVKQGLSYYRVKITLENSQDIL